MTKASKRLQPNAPGGQLDVENWAWENSPEGEPLWDPNIYGEETSWRGIDRPSYRE